MVKTERFLSKREVLANKYKVDVTRGGESAIYSGRAVAALAQGAPAPRASPVPDL
jgi:hypothetical protein